MLKYRKFPYFFILNLMLSVFHYFLIQACTVLDLEMERWETI